jgi:hypothetical protein
MENFPLITSLNEQTWKTQSKKPSATRIAQNRPIVNGSFVISITSAGKSIRGNSAKNIEAFLLWRAVWLLPAGRMMPARWDTNVPIALEVNTLFRRR